MCNLIEQIHEVLLRFPELKLSKVQNDMLISGKLNINCEYKDEHIIDDYEVVIIIPFEYPKVLPKIREIARRIPLKYGHIYSDGELCLAPDEEIKLFFYEKISLNSWIDNYVIPYLFGYSYYEKYGVMPFGERSHGKAGVKEFYKEFFNISTEKQLKKFFDYIRNKEYRYRGHHLCPCGSGNKVRNCHKEVLIKCQEIYIRKVLRQSYIKLWGKVR
ncbi:hypothetical protein AB2T19_000151 [Clostridium botulinum]